MISHGLSLINFNLMAYISEATRKWHVQHIHVIISDIIQVLLNAKITFSQGCATDLQK